MLRNITAVEDESDGAIATLVLNSGRGVQLTEIQNHTIEFILELRGNLPINLVQPPYGAGQQEWHNLCHGGVADV